MKIYLAGENQRTTFLTNYFQRCVMGGGYNELNISNMKLYLAGEHEVKNGSCIENWDNLYILESFYYAKNNRYFPRLIKNFGSFLLDSGAFTFIYNKTSQVDWNKYLEEYAEFINKYDIKLFFELDIDNLVGLQKVEELRNRLEYLTGKKCIPVWHPSRGKEYFVRMCKEYNYVALGGVAGGEVSQIEYQKFFPWFIKTAHQNNSKIHGLGFTSIEKLKLYHFDSVDSTAWVYGNRGGFLYKFNSSTGVMEKYKPSTKYRLKPRQGALHNFNEWVKLQRYADKKF